MSDAPLDLWLQSGRCAAIAGHRLRPQPHPVFGDQAAGLTRNQATTYVLEADDRARWMLKILNAPDQIGTDYLTQLTDLLPNEAVFMAVKQRQILDRHSLGSAAGSYHDAALAEALDGAILMPQVPGSDWATVANQLRSGQWNTPLPSRIAWCYGLIEAVALLEALGCAHRDLSIGNVFIDPTADRVYLIDFESAFLPHLEIPAATTCGTPGYLAPFVAQQDVTDARLTWCAHADRVALAILIAEFLTIDVHAPMAGDGGLFEQDALDMQAGAGWDYVNQQLQGLHPAVLDCFLAAVTTDRFDAAPSPDQWRGALAHLGCQPIPIPRVDDIGTGTLDFEMPTLKLARNQPEPVVSFVIVPPPPPSTDSSIADLVQCMLRQPEA